MALTPLIPQDRAPGDLQDAVVELMRLDAALHANIPQPLRLPMMNLLRKVNSLRISEHRDRPFRLIVTAHFANA